MPTSEIRVVNQVEVRFLVSQYREAERYNLTAEESGVDLRL